MQKHARAKKLILAGLLAVAMAAWIIWHRLGEPVYAGKTLSEWLLMNKKAGLTVLPSETQKAVLALGPSSIRYLEPWAEYRSSPTRDWLLGWVQRIRFGNLGEAEQWTRARRAVFALNCLGTPEAFEALLNVATVQTNASVRDFAVEIICAELKSKPPPALSLVVRSARNSDARIALAAVRALPAFSGERKLAIETLLGALRHKDANVRGTAAQTLAFFGRDALIATPALLSALEDPVLDVRLMAMYALRQIAPQTLETGALDQARRN